MHASPDPHAAVDSVARCDVVHGPEIAVDDLAALADHLGHAVFEPQDAVAHRAHGSEPVRDDDDRLARLLELGELVRASALERFVTDGEHLVDQQHVGVDVDRHGEAEAHVHARTSSSSPPCR